MFADVLISGGDNLILRYVHEFVMAGFLGIGSYVVLYPARNVIKTIKNRFAVLDAVKEELETQRTNHLSHIQTATEAQTKVLEKVAETLEEIRLDQRTLIGKLSK
jgi:predicted Holliday junction resolvase-like endonuclease